MSIVYCLACMPAHGTWKMMCMCKQTCCCCCNCCRATAFCTLATYSASRHARFAGLTPMLDSPCNVAKSGFGSSEIVFFLPRLVVPGFFGPTIDDVYFMISVSGGNRTPSNDDGSLKQYKHKHDTLKSFDWQTYERSFTKRKQ